MSKETQSPSDLERRRRFYSGIDRTSAPSTITPQTGEIGTVWNPQKVTKDEAAQVLKDIGFVRSGQFQPPKNNEVDQEQPQTEKNVLPQRKLSLDRLRQVIEEKKDKIGGIIVLASSIKKPEITLEDTRTLEEKMRAARISVGGAVAMRRRRH